MLAATYPLQFLLMTISGLVNRLQADVIAYLVEENRVLEPLGPQMLTGVQDSRKLVGRRLRRPPPIRRRGEITSEPGNGDVQGTERLGGILKHYSRAA